MDARILETKVKDRYRQLKQAKGYIGPEDVGTLQGDDMPSDQIRALIAEIAPMLPDPK